MKLEDFWGLGVTLIVALVGGMVTLIVRFVRGPVQVQDLWKENRDLRTEMKGLEDRLTARIETLQKTLSDQATDASVLAEGFDALSNYVERTSGGRRPSFNPEELEPIERARALRGDARWNTFNPHA